MANHALKLPTPVLLCATVGVCSDSICICKSSQSYILCICTPFVYVNPHSCILYGFVYTLVYPPWFCVHTSISSLVLRTHSYILHGFPYTKLHTAVSGIKEPGGSGATFTLSLHVALQGALSPDLNFRSSSSMCLTCNFQSS